LLALFEYLSPVATVETDLATGTATPAVAVEEEESDFAE
jgi:hypothetical protein